MIVKLKDLIVGTYFETDVDLYDEKLEKKSFEDYIETAIFAENINEILKKEKCITDEKLKFFLDTVVYQETKIDAPYRLSVYGRGVNEKYLVWLPYDKLIEYTSILKNYIGLNLYFLPLPFKNCSGKECNAGLTQCFYVDIDNISFCFSGETYEERRYEIVEFLMNEYDVPYECLPPFVVASGHGLHLYFTTPVEKGTSKSRKQKIKRVCGYFNGDFTGVSPAHIIRVPTSYNAKSEPIPSELFVLKDDAEYSWDYIEPLMVSQEDCDKLYKNFHKNKKNKKTEEAEVPTEIVPLEEKVPSEATIPIFEEAIPVEKPKPHINHHYENLPILNNKSMFNQRYIDLLNYFYRRNGKIEGYRDKFFLILISTLRAWGLSDTEAEKKCLRLVDDSFASEMQSILSYVYSLKTPYKYTNEYIAQALDFTEIDFIESYGCYRYSDKLKRERIRARKNYEPKKKANENKRENIKAFIRNSTMSNKELADYFNISVSTIKRIKSEIRQENEKLYH